jgi:lactoylglutathione lyase
MASRNEQAGSSHSRVSELRVVIAVDNYSEAVRLYRDVLGLTPLADFSTDQGQCLLLDAGRATLELGDRGHAAEIDQLEVGHSAGNPSA